MNLRPSGYEPDELPGCSTPRWDMDEGIWRGWPTLVSWYPAPGRDFWCVPFCRTVFVFVSCAFPERFRHFAGCVRRGFARGALPGSCRGRRPGGVEDVVWR